MIFKKSVYLPKISTHAIPNMQHANTIHMLSH